MEKLRSTGRPVEDVVVETLEGKFIDLDEADAQPLVSLSREEVMQRLVAGGFIREPGTWDTPGAKAWRELPESEKVRHRKEMEAIYLPDAAASTAIIRDRKRLEQDVPRAEIERRLRNTGLIRPTHVWDTAEARRWEALPADKKETFIAEMNQFSLRIAQLEALKVEDPAAYLEDLEN
ncbi:MAG: hypothetical protein R2867_29150 [Caldilineaceae bacterium]